MSDLSSNRSERILNSLQGLQKATMPDFFYTRLTGRMQNEMPEPRGSVLLRPALLAMSLTVVLVLNIVALRQMNNGAWSKKGQPSNETEAASIRSFAKAYNLTTESVYE